MSQVVAITGASGYVGSIVAAGCADMALVRLGRPTAADTDVPWTLERPDPGLTSALAARGVTDVVHLAWDMSTSSRREAERVCVDGSLALLRAAKTAGAERFIFVSTISAFASAKSVYGQTKKVVEDAVLADGGIVLRLGLVHGGGQPDGGMYGAIRHSVRKGRIVPLIGSGTGPQYLLDAPRLQRAIRRALAGELDDVAQPITLADETPIRFRDLVTRIAHDEGCRPILVPVPWRLLHAGLAGAEWLGVRTPVRSDSVISFVHADPAPDFSAAQTLGL